MSQINLNNPTLFAQTFFVDPAIWPNGVYATRVDIPFQTVDPFLPITLQLRPTTTDGLPDTINSFPGSDIILSPDSIILQTTTGVDGDYPDFGNNNTYTAFSFTSPIYLPPGQHAIVLKTASTNYEVYCAIQGDDVLGTLNPVQNPPFVGNLFVPSNASTWNPITNKALMFKLWTANFNNGTVGTLEFDVSAPANTNSTFDIFSVSTNDFNIGSTKTTYAYISKDNNGFVDTSQTPLIINRNYFPQTPRLIQSSGDFKVFTTLSSSSNAISPMIDTTRVNITMVDYIINQGELSNTIINVTNGGAGYNSLTTSVTVDSPVGLGGTKANAVANVTSAGTIDKVYLNILGSGYYTTPNVKIIGANTTQALANCIGETSSSGGNAVARYISRQVTLSPGFSASDLKVFITANRQASTDIEIYFKVQNLNDPDQNFNAKLWQRMILTTNSGYFSQTNQDFVEYSYASPQSLLIPSKSIGYNNNGITYNGFNIFAIKICLFAQQTTIIPVVNNFRAVAIS